MHLQQVRRCGACKARGRRALLPRRPPARGRPGATPRRQAYRSAGSSRSSTIYHSMDFA
jgi:hypothetical protein